MELTKGCDEAIGVFTLKARDGYRPVDLGVAGLIRVATEPGAGYYVFSDGTDNEEKWAGWIVNAPGRSSFAASIMWGDMAQTLAADAGFGRLGGFADGDNSVKLALEIYATGAVLAAAFFALRWLVRTAFWNRCPSWQKREIDTVRRLRKHRR
jgi:hypothetical protein